jgi:hypothetical protein
MLDVKIIKSRKKFKHFQLIKIQRNKILIRISQVIVSMNISLNKPSYNVFQTFLGKYSCKRIPM